MKNIVVKTPFLDATEKRKRRTVGEKILVTLERAKHLIELGLAVAATVQEAKEIMEAEPKPAEVVFKPGQQWAESTEIKPVKKAAKKK